VNVIANVILKEAYGVLVKVRAGTWYLFWEVSALSYFQNAHHSETCFFSYTQVTSDGEDCDYGD
jgi:hypothetical protein